jgi:GH15 family glucan-1,4-alpha-glucosidase
VPWLCVPRFDSEALFCGILDAARGGAFTIAPADLTESRQYYEEDSAVLVTEMRCPSGLVRLTDAMTLRGGADLTEDVSAARQELLRSVQVLDGEVHLSITVEPRGGAETERLGGGLLVRCARRRDLDLHLSGTLPLDGLRTTWRLKSGDTASVALDWGGGRKRHHAIPPERRLKETLEAWRRWMTTFRYGGPQIPLVRRSAITLKLLDHFQNGAIVAAPTSSLPEAIGGIRNWDYRYAWIRDAALSVYVLHRIGFSKEAAGFLGWVLDAVDRGGRPGVLYDLDGRHPPPEREDGELAGYRGSRPVRWGNGAAGQRQNDAYGEILDCAYQWSAHHGSLDLQLWSRLVRLIEAAARRWRTPDHGIWEVRTAGRPFTYSAAMCHVALDRGARMAERFQLPGDIARWRRCASQIREAILEEAWDPRRNSLTEHLGGGGVDASLLSLPLRRAIPFDHPRMIATTQAVARELGAGNGLLYRYRVETSPDGLPGHEGAFLLCSFWMVDNLAGQGRLDEAIDLYDSLCARANHLGLLSEQIDPVEGVFLGNYPQAFSHVGIIASGVRLSRLMNGRDKPD